MRHIGKFPHDMWDVAFKGIVHPTFTFHPFAAHHFVSVGSGDIFISSGCLQ